LDFNLPADLTAYLAELDRFIEREIKPLEAADDNIRFFDHRREWARTDFDNQGLPRPQWEALMAEARRRADRAGHLRFGLPREYGGRDGSHLWMAVIREHLAARGLGLHNDLQTEHSIVANHPLVLAIRAAPALLRYIVEKGSIAAAGVSLTVNAVDADGFSVAIIPHTRDHTTLGDLALGDRVNLEVDILAKHVEKLVNP
jgi:alkylation response protein AidB-like acyl-CoA dehydrogenase